MSRIMFSLPNQLIHRMKSTIPAGHRSELLAKLLEKEIQAREANLYKRAAELEACKGLHAEMENWDNEFGQDGLADV